MQTNVFPIQPSGASPVPQRATLKVNADTSQFSAALSHEMGQRQAMPAPAPAMPPVQKPAAPAAKPQAADKPAQAAPAQEPSRQPDTKAAAKSDSSAETDETGDDAAEGAQSAAATTAADMLALVASLTGAQQAPSAPALGGEQAAAALLGQAKGGVGKDEKQLAALQAAIKGMGADGDKASGKALAVTDDLRNPAGAALAADPKLGAAVDLRAVGEQALKGGSFADVAQAAQQAREAALKEPAPAVSQLAAQTQASALQLTQAAAGASGERIAARVGTTAWDNQVGQKIVWMAAGGDQSAELTLNPPDLGPLQVVLNVSNDQASVAFSSNQLEVRQALENALPRLREMMSESGIALGNATVDAGGSDQRQAQGEQGRGGSASGARLESAVNVVDNTMRTARSVSLGDRGMVDTFA